MAEYRLHCFGESGNAYKAALMLQLSGADWEPVFVPFFQGVTRGADWRAAMNDMGEVPVLDHGDRRLTQSGVILDYLVATTGRFGWRDEDERREVLRWILYDNHKFTSYFATLRFLVGLRKMEESDATRFLRGRARDAFGIVDRHLAHRQWMVGDGPTIADLSMAGYMFYDEPTGIDIADEFQAIDAWRQRIRALPGWKGPWELMPAA